MTRITTITGALAAVGKTQLALNLALELVRRGRFAGVYSDPAAFDSLGDMLSLPVPAVAHRRRADDAPPGDVVRRGYQGMDLLTCRLGLDDWPDCDSERMGRCISDLDSREGYDDLLVDTSSMSAQAVLACCLSAQLVLLVVTPEPAAHAQAFALLRILLLNGFSGELRLVVNRVRCSMDGLEIQQALAGQTRAHLDTGLPLLGTLAEDPRVAAALRFRQAFSTVFPETEVSAGIVVLADRYEDLALPEETQRQPLETFWRRLLDQLGRDMRLPGMAEPEAARVRRSGS